MTPQPAPRQPQQPQPCSPPHRRPQAQTSPRPPAAPAPFVEPVAAVRPLQPSPPSPSRSTPGGHAVRADGDSGTVAEHLAVDLDAAGAMGEGAGETGAPRRSSLKKTASAFPEAGGGVAPARPHQQRHHRHHSDPDPTTATTLEEAADGILHWQLLEREKRLRQQQHAVQDKASRSAPQRGRRVTVTASNNYGGPRLQRWSIGEPTELLAGAAAWAPWDATPAPYTPAPSEAPATANGVPSLSLQIKHGPGLGHHHLQQPERCTADIGHHRLGLGDEPVFTDHLVRFVYPERACRSCPLQLQDVGVQAPGPPPLQLRILPQHRCGCGRGRGRGQDEAVSPCLWLVQAVFCLAGLACVILVLALVGAAAFHATEGPHEDLQVRQLNREQADLVVQLATDLRVVLPDDAAWRAAIERSVESHEQMVLRAAAAGYGEGGAGEGGARIWTYPGGLLFAASLLTTLGFGAPVPRTPLGRLTAVLLAVVGIPLNVVLALQLGRQLCGRLPRLLPLLSASRPPPSAVHPSPPAKGRAPCTTCWPAGPTGGPAPDLAPDAAGSGSGSGFRWAPLLLPVGSLLLYYLLGMVLFGSVLALPASEWVVFPLSLTAAGGVARVPGWARVLYAAYLEGGVLLAAVAVALLQAPATTATTDFAMGLGILDLDDYHGSA